VGLLNKKKEREYVYSKTFNSRRWGICPLSLCGEVSVSAPLALSEKRGGVGGISIEGVRRTIPQGRRIESALRAGIKPIERMRLAQLSASSRKGKKNTLSNVLQEMAVGEKRNPMFGEG